MATNYLDKTGLGTLWGKIKGLIPTKVSDLNNDSGFQTQAQVENAIAQSAEIVVVNLTSTTTNGVTTYTADKTYSDLHNAYDAGKTLILHYGYFFYYLAVFGASRFRFVCVNPISSVPSAFTITSSDVTTYKEFKNVLTVNGQDGTVTLTYSDVGALPDSTVIPTKVSDLNNDSGFQTQAQVNALIAAAGDDDTTYAISISGNVITLTGSDGNTSTVTLPVYTGGVV